MSETGDKRVRSDLDLFVLALLEGGIRTPYELKAAAGLSPGATIPALRRLTDAGLVDSGAPGPRGRIAYRVTATAKEALNTGWRGLIEQSPSGDLDSDLRVALLALWSGGKRRIASDYLRRSAARKLESARGVSNQEISASTLPLADWYRALRLESTRALLQGEAATILRIAKALLKRTQSPIGRSRPIPKKPLG